jgi:hypothetical protein
VTVALTDTDSVTVELGVAVFERIVGVTVIPRGRLGHSQYHGT